MMICLVMFSPPCLSGLLCIFTEDSGQMSIISTIFNSPRHTHTSLSTLFPLLFPSQLHTTSSLVVMVPFLLLWSNVPMIGNLRTKGLVWVLNSKLCSASLWGSPSYRSLRQPVASHHSHEKNEWRLERLVLSYLSLLNTLRDPKSGREWSCPPWDCVFPHQLRCQHSPTQTRSWINLF